MEDNGILESEPVHTLERLIEEATRSTQHGVSRFVEPAPGTLSRATSRQHHLIFGRRGSGKSSLLRKAALDLTVDRRPIAFVDLESFKGHAYPDVLLSVLIETFGRFAEWLETAAIAPANKSSFWSKLFGSKPSRKPFDKGGADTLSKKLRKAVSDLRDLLFSEDQTTITSQNTNKIAVEQADKAHLDVGYVPVKSGVILEDKSQHERASSISETYTLSKTNYLHRHILDYQTLFREMANLSGGDAFLILDDLYHLRKKDQPNVIDYFHRIAKGNSEVLSI